MSRAIVVLRPEPGNSATVAAIRAGGGQAVAMPLFAVEPLSWTPPDLTEVDALLLTSANAVRAAGPGLAALAALPVYAVGGATAAAARAAGLTVTAEGRGDMAAIAGQAAAAGRTRLLHLAGAERMPTPPAVAVTIEVYHTRALVPDAEALAAMAGAVVMVHSPRAARRLGEFVAVERRGTTSVTALSETIAAAAGPGWREVVASERPSDAALVALALRLAD